MFKYFDITEVLPFQALFNFIIGERGVGKTYSTKKMLVRRFEKHGDKFIFVKRSEAEVKDIAPRFFNDMCDEHRDIMYVGGVFYIGFPKKDDESKGVKKSRNRGKKTVENVEHSVKKTDDHVTIKTSISGRPEFEYQEFGRTVGLRTTTKLKGMPYDESYRWAIFDEFIPIDPNGWLYDEAARIFDIHETVFRMRDNVQWIFLANSNNKTYLPIFEQMDCDKVTGFVPGKVERMRSNTVLVLYTKNEAYQKAKSQTKFGKATDGTEWFKSMIKNVSLTKEYEEWVGVGSDYAAPLFYLSSADHHYGFCNHYTGKKWAIIEVNKLPATNRRYSIDGDDITLKVWQPRSNILDCLASKRLRFDKIQTAETFFKFFGKL